MAAKISDITHVQHIQHERFTAEQHGYQLVDLSLDLSGNIAVSGYHSNGHTYIDLYSGKDSDSRDKLKLFYSKEFEKYSDYLPYRFVSFLDKNVSKLVTCIDDKIEIIDTKNESKVLRSCKVNGKIITCLAVREGEIFIGLVRSQTVLVFNNDLKETKKIKIKGIKDDDCPCDLQVIKDTVFVRTLYDRVLLLSVYDGSTVSEYTDTTAMYSSNALSIAVSEEMNLVAVLWSDYPKRGIVVYSLNKNKSFLVYDVDSDVIRIRISSRDRKIITGNWKTGEIKMYDLDQLFSFEAMKRTLACLISPDECEELRKYFQVTEEEMGRLEAGDEDRSKKLSDREKRVKRMEHLLTIIEKKGHLTPYNINTLTDAVSTLGDESHISQLEGPMEGYSLHSKNMNSITVAEMMIRQKTWEDERNQLISKLETAESKVKKHVKTLDDLQGQLLHVSEEAQQWKEDLANAEGLIKDKEKLTEELEQSKEESERHVELLTIKLDQSEQSIGKSGKKIETLENKLDQSEQSSKDFERKIVILTAKLEQSEQSIADSERQREILTAKLEQSEQSIAESERQREILTAKLEQSEQSIAESERQREILTAKLGQSEQSIAESDKKIVTLEEKLDWSEQINREFEKKIVILTTELKKKEQTIAESDRQRGTLAEELKRTKQSTSVISEELRQLKSKSDEKIELLTSELSHTKQELSTRTEELGTTNTDLHITRTELRQYQLDFVKESKALKEVLNQAKDAIAELQKRPFENQLLDDSEETEDVNVGGATLAAEFGRLTVAVAEYLTLGECLKLAKVCNLPTSDYDMVYRVGLSYNDSPGIKLLDVLKKRKVINMFDVTNLQKALAMLQLEAVNHDVVAPYQKKIGEEQYELNKTEKMFTWEDINKFVSKDKLPCKEASPDDGTEPGYTSQTEVTSEGGEDDRGSLIIDRPHHLLYAEQIVGREGGTLRLTNVALTVPSDALHENHVIAISVMNESPFPLDREVDTARMTPLIKLEPLGLTFKKPVQLNIPHSALISEPENHDVIIHSGRLTKTDDDSSDIIRWTEERSIPRQLKDKSVTVDIQCLTFLSASLVSQTSAPPLHIVRAVPFVDRVRNTLDDIILTICFCSDNDSEYNMLLSDYKTKLPLEQYSTLQLHRHSKRDGDDAGFLSMAVTSGNNTYIPDKEQSMKKLAVSHLCTASRDSHQIRLKKNQVKDRDVVDVLFTFTQAEYEPTQISLKARIKDLIISEESEKLVFGPVSSGNKKYEDMLVSISRSLETVQCKDLAAYFHLNSKDSEMITSSEDPGMMLMKTLEERSVVDPQKMIDFFEGLKACNLDETAKLVSDYIGHIAKVTPEETQESETDKSIEETQDGKAVSQYRIKKSQKLARSSISDQSVQTTLSSSCVSSVVHVKTLTKEGYSELEVVEALDISRNRLVTARKVLQFLGEQLVDVPPSKDCVFLHKEQYIDENGGEIVLREPNVHLLVPVGAVSEGNIVSLTMMTGNQRNVPSEKSTLQLSPVVRVGPEGSTLTKDAILQIPLCASETEGVTSADILLGFSRHGEEVQWRKRKQHEPAPSLKKDHLEIHLQTLCAICPNIAVDFRKPLTKRFRVLPFINRVKHPTDDLTLTFWIYNDDEIEHMNLLHEEINVNGKVQLRDFERFTLKGFDKDREVHVKSENSKIPSAENVYMKKVHARTLWHNTRHAVVFHFQNKEGINDTSFRLKLCGKQVWRTAVDLQFDVKVQLSELLQNPQESSRPLLTTQEPHPAMEKSFRELLNKVSEQLDMDSCLDIAGIFRLSFDSKERVKSSSEPAKTLFDELIQSKFIAAASVSALDVALTRTGHVHLAEEVKEYRRRNPSFPTTIYTYL